MSLGPVIRPLEKSLFRTLGEAIAKPAIPELAARGTAEAPTVLREALAAPEQIGQRAKEIPFAGDPALREATRATEVSKKTVEDRIRDMKTVIGAFFRADPDLPKDLQNTLYEGRWRKEAAHNNADLELQKVYEPLKTNPPQKAALMYDYLVTADEVAQALRGERPDIHGQPLEKWQNQLSALEPQVNSDPEIQETIGKRRDLWDKVFDDMVARGWTVPEHYLEDYTPIRKLHAVAQGLASMGGEELKAKYLPMMMHRTGAGGARETNLVSLEKDILGDYMQKVSEHEMFTNLLDDPTVNFTSHFKLGDVIPKKLAIYQTGPGLVGFDRQTTEGYLLAGQSRDLGLKPDLLTPGGYVFPKPLVEALNRFNGPKASSKTENMLYKAGRGLAKWMTVYNPANTHLNMASDLAFAMFGGMPGEAAHPIGIFKWYNKVGVPASAKGAFGKGGTLVEINGQVVDVWDLAQREGLTEGTIHHDVGAGNKLSDQLAQLIPANERETHMPVLDVLQRERLAVEAAPRIAAGMEAWERTGNLKEFGRVGRAITLPYGAGAPLASRFPAIRLISPFIQFAGLATARVVDQLGAAGSRNRAIAGVMAIPVATYMWNTQNDEYKEVEHSLAPWEQSQAHVIVPDPKDPSKVRRDIAGKPVVLRFRFWVPEEVARMAGVGNLAGRAMRVKEGRDKPMDFLQSIPQQSAENIADLLTMPGLVNDVARGETRTGKKMKWPERVLRLFPIGRQVAEGVQGARDYGPVEGVKRLTEEAAGIKFANVGRKGKHLTDTDLADARREVLQARSAWKIALLNGPPSKVKTAKEDFYGKVEELKRIVDVVQKEKTNAKQ